MGAKSVPRGKYCRNSRLVFSFVPRCQGLCGSQKYTFTSVATVKSLCFAISSPRSHVIERRRVAGSLRGGKCPGGSISSVLLRLFLLSKHPAQSIGCPRCTLGGTRLRRHNISHSPFSYAPSHARHIRNEARVRGRASN